MLDLPYPQQPVQEVQKMDQKTSLIQKIKMLCEKSMHLNNDYSEGKCSLEDRAFFLDVCNATNADEIFSFKVASSLSSSLSDGFVPGATDNYLLAEYHIEDSAIWALSQILADEGRGANFLKSLPLECDFRALCVIYTIMIDNPAFTPQFTEFTFGGTMQNMPPLRLEDGTPNPEFFLKWSSETEKRF